MAHKEHLSWSSHSSFSICVGCNGPRESNDIGGGREIMHSVPFPTVITGCLTLHRPFVLTCSALVLSALVNRSHNRVLHEPLVAWPNDLPAEQVCNILLDRGDLSYRATKGWTWPAASTVNIHITVAKGSCSLRPLGFLFQWWWLSGILNDKVKGLKTQLFKILWIINIFNFGT